MTLVHDHTHRDADLEADLDREAAMVARAAACAPTLTRNAAQHDQDGSWVQGSFDEVRRAGLLRIAVPAELGGDGATIREDTLGMRGTASHDVTFDDVFVPEDRVLADRPNGTLDGPLQVISSIAFPVIAAVYLGVAEGAYEHTVAKFAARPTDQSTQRRIGLMGHHLRVAGWALDGALAAVGDNPSPSMDTVVSVMAAKREIALAAILVCDLAMELGGGDAFRKGSPIERAFRDVRAAKFHPFDPETTLVHAGRHALGLPSDQPRTWAAS